MNEVFPCMVKSLDVEAVRFSTMQTILALALKRDIVAWMIENYRSTEYGPIPAELRATFLDLSVAWSEEEGTEQRWMVISGKTIDSSDPLRLFISETMQFDYAAFVQDLTLEQLLPSDFEIKIECSKRALSRVVPLVAKYNNTVATFNRVEKELNGLSLLAK